ncbi:protein Wiz isoform X2 [Labeo rohita]|uniref:protein Wiz isoform X2 n=1 Tax=Labeo rohita TaxID=84645 RepID=UPI0021E2CC56|nr:protein Wiz isoform X2 [Labeo rohita]
MEKTAPDTAKKTNTATLSGETISSPCLEKDLDKDLDKDLGDSDLGIHSCEFCGTNFESRRGLSSHARFHLRQMGVAVSDSSGAPIDLLYQLMKEKGGTLPKLKKQVKPVQKFKTKSPNLKKDTGPKLKIKISNLVKKKYALSSSSPIAVKGSAASARSSSPFAVGKPRKVSLKKVVVSTPTSALSVHKEVEYRLSDGSPSTSLSVASTKPLWAPQETDAPLNLETMLNSTVRDDTHVCELCGAWYETRKGLSSHVRAHLRQFGVILDSKGSPIDMLHKFIQSEDFKEKASAVHWEGSDFDDYTSPSSTPSTSSAISKNPPLAPLSVKGLTSIRPTPPPIKKKNISQDISGNLPLSDKVLFKSPPSAKTQKISQDVSENLPLSGQIELKSPPLKKKQKISQDVSGNLPVSGQIELKSPPLKKKKKISLDASGISPLSDSAELILSPPSKKQKISTDVSEDLSFSKKTELKSPPSVAKPKISPDVSASLALGKNADFKTPAQGEPSKDVSCEFCHEKFKKSQSLASHARYHLRQMGITEWSVHGSPMATLREVMAQRGSSAGSLSPLGPPSLTPPVSPSVPPSVPPLLASPKPITQPSSPSPVPRKVPKAKKGFRTVIPKPKDEPVEVDISIIESPKPQSAPTSPLTPLSDSNTVRSPVIAPKPEKQEPKPFVCCDYCGEMFDTRKALSCHARGHLRQLGVRWSLKVPPIEALYELMKREGTQRASQIKSEPASGKSAVQWKKTASSPQALTLSPGKKEQAASDSTSAGCDATCELCGFDFENRKALASHARAHLRQQGVDWKVIGSPIETLAAWMKSEPEKVAELHKSYMKGDLPLVKKASRRTSTPYSSSDSESVRLGSHKASSAAQDSAGHPQVSQLSKATREGKAGMSHSSSSHKKRSSSYELSSNSLIQIPTARSELNVRSPRGCERRPPKHLSHSESVSGETEPSKPSRAGNIPSLVPRPPEHSLVKLVGKVYSLKCRFCEEVFRGPLSIQEDWVIHLQQHILKLKKDSASASSPQPPLSHSDAPLLIGPQAV